MDLPVIEMDRTEARKAFLEYRRAVRERHDLEDAQIMRGYRELARGRQVINLPQTFSAAGRDERGYPCLAIARADTKRCWVDCWSDRIEFCQTGGYHRHSFASGRCVRVQAPEGARALPAASAIVPSIPPPLRPAGALTRFHVLWEADWVQAPRDPALLRHIGGDLWAVLAVWDLTELERAVLSGRR